MTNRSLSEILPVEPGASRVKALLFNSPSRAVVAVVGPPEPDTPIRLFVRHLSEDYYREVALPTPTSFFSTVAVASEAPLAFAVVSDSTDASRNDLVRFSLPEATVGSVPFNPFGHDGKRQWIFRVLAATGDGSVAHIVLGSTPWPEPRDVGFAVQYSIAAISADTGVVRIIGHLHSAHA